MAIIEIQNLAVKRGSTDILQELQWSVGEKEHWVVLGANGSGKTTLLNCITGYVTPSQGVITVLNRRYGKSDWRDLRKEVGMVSSSIRHWIGEGQTALNVVASGRNAEINSWRNPNALLKKEALNLLTQVEADYLAERAWTHLSQGERQRVLIGRALMARYKILILDEPCSGLDPVAREKFLQFLQRLAESASTPSLILVTHHVEEILPCFDHAMVLKEGCVLAKGLIRKVVKTSVLSKAFGVPLTVKRNRERYELRIGKTHVI
jgi:iron complex transport system ATP-binding protein